MIYITLTFDNRKVKYIKLNKNDRSDFADKAYISKIVPLFDGKQISGWLCPIVNIPIDNIFRDCNYKSHSTIATSQSSHEVHIANIYIPVCAKCKQKIDHIIKTQYNHYVFAHWILNQYTISDIANHILRQIARPLK